MNKKGNSMVWVIVIFLIGITSIGVTGYIINDYNNQISEINETLINKEIEFKALKENSTYEINLLNNKINKLMMENNELRSANKELLSKIYEILNNPIIIIIKETSNSVSSSKKEIVCEPCLEIGRCPPGKKLEMDGVDKCGCAIRPRCIDLNQVIK